MADELNNVKIDFGKFSKPADTLVKRIAEATGLLYAPLHVKRMAKAAAEASLIKAQSQIAVADLKRRTAKRMQLEEMRNQHNMESIADKALHQLKENTDASKVDTDWMAFFFNKCRITSEEALQELWARVLAGEADAPGSFSKRTINIISELDKKSAEAFFSLCCFSFGERQHFPIIMDFSEPLYQENGVTYERAVSLESIGLLKMHPTGFYTHTSTRDSFQLNYFGRQIHLKTPRKSFNRGMMLFTPTGQELAQISGAMEIPGYFEYVLRLYKAILVKEPK